MRLHVSNQQRVRLSGEESVERGSSKHAKRLRLQFSLAALDLVMISLGMMAFAAVYLSRLEYERLTTFLPLVLPIYLFYAVRQRAFSLPVVISPTRSTRRACLSLVLAIVTVIIATFMLKASDGVSRGLTLAGGGLSCLLLVIGRAVFAGRADAALEGSPDGAVVLVDGLPPPAECTGLQVDVQALGIRPDISNPAMLDRLGKIIHEADRVIVSCQPKNRPDWALALKGAGVNVEVLAPELDEMGAIPTTRYYGTATALIAAGPLNLGDRILKRVFDLVLTVPVLLVLMPALVLIGIAIKLESPGPALFVQSRVGRGNRQFPMYKFRSMYTDRLDHSASKLTTRNDARVTRIGRFIRATSIDELPQLFNVIRGDMSIVGPRPHATGALAGDALYWEVSSVYWSRHAVKPGLTGLAQVKGFRGNTETMDDLRNRLQADLEYLTNWSIWRDLALVMQTFGVLVHKNAF